MPGRLDGMTGPTALDTCFAHYAVTTRDPVDGDEIVFPAAGARDRRNRPDELLPLAPRIDGRIDEIGVDEARRRFGPTALAKAQRQHLQRQRRRPEQRDRDAREATAANTALERLIAAGDPGDRPVRINAASPRGPRPDGLHSSSDNIRLTVRDRGSGERPLEIIVHDGAPQLPEIRRQRPIDALPFGLAAWAAAVASNASPARPPAIAVPTLLAAAHAHAYGRLGDDHLHALLHTAYPALTDEKPRRWTLQASDDDGRLLTLTGDRASGEVLIDGAPSGWSEPQTRAVDRLVRALHRTATPPDAACVWSDPGSPRFVVADDGGGRTVLRTIEGG